MRTDGALLKAAESGMFEKISDEELDRLNILLKECTARLMAEGKKRLANLKEPEKIAFNKEKGRWKGKPKEPEAQEIIDEVKRK